MNHNQTARSKAVTQQQEPIFNVGVIGIVDQTGIVVQEHGLRFLERNAMLGQLDRALRRSQANSILPTALF
jgi:hypothetical protein